MHAPHSTDCSCLIHDPKTKQRQLLIALAFVSSFAGVELCVGLSSHSLALLAESGHMVSDCFALLLAFLATRMSQSSLQWGWIGVNTIAVKPNRSLETWAALLNSCGLVMVTVWIAWEAIARFGLPAPDIASQPMLITAIVGLIINGINIAVLHQGSDIDLNLRAAFLHVVADALGAVGVIFAAIAVAAFHWVWADSVISLAIAVLILGSAVPLIGQSLKQLKGI
ncbi:MAG: cation diffusion facilitator family transporter [Myxacorys chilensis ATA2-1-KO14]|nr:cation diffusion facilitator family transporter [Myxacorys chilensis ATA2-1-KO14]